MYHLSVYCSAKGTSSQVCSDWASLSSTPCSSSVYQYHNSRRCWSKLPVSVVVYLEKFVSYHPAEVWFLVFV